MKTQLYFHGQNREYSFALILKRKIIRESGRVPVHPEYYSLIKGLEKALSIGVQEITAYGDCKSVVEQINRNKPLPLTQKTRALLSKFRTAEVRWIPEEKNKAVVQKKKSIEVKQIEDGIYLTDGKYIVNLHNNTCTCPEFVIRNKDFLTGKSEKVKDCVHLKAVKRQVKEEVVK